MDKQVLEAGQEECKISLCVYIPKQISHCLQPKEGHRELVLVGVRL